jgi:hypothetical protein
MKRRLARFALFAAILGSAWLAVAQWGGPRRGGGLRSFPQDSGRPPQWENPRAFKRDVFTFARIEYDHGGYGGRGGWDTDYEGYGQAELNLGFRLQQMTSLKVDDRTMGKTLRLTDRELGDYPFIYIVEAGALYLGDDEAAALRKHLLNGGFLMIDDFWGEPDWRNMADEVKKAFPDKEWIDLPADHPIFNGIFKLDKTKLQTPNIGLGMQSLDPGSGYFGVTWEREDAREVHFRALFDDKGRIMALACHNTDNGDGWEQEGAAIEFFREFSEKKNYPLMINILFYTMTH